ncbi:mechanosensitive ion channel family protein [Velocimicrobium porci]|uniref:Mechanosensitive ion channel n=1 Tax=Velocimicrobium porci TaxID=2606634 RepID=A0A6L5XUH9_9FIRM|nr:mechanosensitive ion channel domain-containing protein [Velocimicrobium porci]MSS62342.1 mechanosensitive ion channel [Velocimicrobium porci]
MNLLFGFLATSGTSNEITTKEAITWIEKLIPALITLGKNLVFALIFIVIARRLIRWLKKILDRSFKRSSLDEGVSKFLLSLISVSLNILMVIVAINIIGIATGSLVALLGSAGLTLGLALQGSLQNFAGGVLILIMKPFRIGDYIIAGADEGTVTGIDIFYTKLLTIDNRKIVIPNGGLSNQSIINVTNEENRRLDLSIPIEYSANIKQVKELLFAIIMQYDSVLKEQPIDVFVSEFADSAILIGVRMWTKKEDYWQLKWALLEEIKERFDENHISIPFNQLDVTIRTDLSGSSNLIK